MEGEVPDRVAVRDEDVEIGQGGAGRAPEGGPGAGLAAQDRGTERSAEGDVGQGIHGDSIFDRREVPESVQTATIRAAWPAKVAELVDALDLGSSG